MLGMLLAGGAVPSDNPLNFNWDYIVGNLPLAGIAAAIGIVMVFVILGVLIGFVTLFRVIVNKSESSQKLKDMKARSAVRKTEKAAAREGKLARACVYGVEQTATVPVAECVDPSVVAAITAAVSAVLTTENSGTAVDFVIKKIKRTR